MTNDADGEATLIANIARETGARVVSTNDAVGKAIEALGGKRIALLTPYLDELNQAIRAGLERRGLTVVNDRCGLRCHRRLSQLADSRRSIGEFVKRPTTARASNFRFWSDLSPLSGEERNFDFGAVRSVDDPMRSFP